MFTQKYDALLSDEHKKKGFSFRSFGKTTFPLSTAEKIFMNIKFQRLMCLFTVKQLNERSTT